MAEKGSPPQTPEPRRWGRDWIDGSARCPACENDTGMNSKPLRWTGEEYSEGWACRCGAEWTVWFQECAVDWDGTTYSTATGDRRDLVEAVERLLADPGDADRQAEVRRALDRATVSARECSAGE